MHILAAIMIIIGLAFLAVSSIGLLRLPDFFSRTHAAGKSETLGAILVLGGLAIYNGFELSSFKLAFILIFMSVANPVAIHAVARAAHHSGIDPWTLQHKVKHYDESIHDDEAEEDVENKEQAGCGG